MFLKQGPDERAQLKCDTNAAATNVIASNICLFGPASNTAVNSCRSMNHFLTGFWTITKRFAIRVWTEIHHGFKICVKFSLKNSGKNKNKKLRSKRNHGLLCIFAAFAAVCDDKFAASLMHLCRV